MIKRNIVLVGMMGSGKSHIGRKLAVRLGWQFVDTDRRIERQMGQTIADFLNGPGKRYSVNGKSMCCNRSAATMKRLFLLAGISQ